MRALVVLLAILAGACGGHDVGDIDEVVGNACTDDGDCDSRCYRDSDFPQGFCSLPCSSDQDCPSDTYCMQTHDGVCMFACPAFDCDRLGVGWECRDRSRIDGGEIDVCSGD